MRKVAIHGANIIMSSDVADELVTLGVTPEVTLIGDVGVKSVPHTIQATNLLRNLGFPVRSSMTFGGYDFPGSFRPFKHQLATAEFLVTHPRSLCLNSPGLGKTSSCVWAVDYLMKQKAIRKVLVICPLSCVESVWAREIFNIAPQHKVMTLVGGNKERLAVIRNKADWIITNHDATNHIWQALAANELGVDHIIVDEATAYKVERSQRTSGLKKIVYGKSFWLLTGTPTPQEPTDGYMLCKLVNPDAPQTMAQFKNETMRRMSQYVWLPKRNATEIVAKYMSPAIRFNKADCLDMPPITMEDRLVTLTPAQNKAIADLKKEWVHDIGDGAKIVAQTAAVRLNKLFQIGQGQVISDSGVREIGADSRIQTCVDLISESNSKTIIFAPYTASIEYINKEISKRFKAVVVDGNVSSHDRLERFKLFDNDPDTRVLIAHPATTSHGLTLTAASTTIWFGPYNKFEGYDQANQRTDRPGQKHAMRIINIYGMREELIVYKAARKAIDQQNAVLELKKLVGIE